MKQIPFKARNITQTVTVHRPTTFCRTGTVTHNVSRVSTVALDCLGGIFACLFEGISSLRDGLQYVCAYRGAHRFAVLGKTYAGKALTKPTTAAHCKEHQPLKDTGRVKRFLRLQVDRD